MIKMIFGGITGWFSKYFDLAVVIAILVVVGLASYEAYRLGGLAGDSRAAQAEVQVQAEAAKEALATSARDQALAANAENVKAIQALTDRQAAVEAAIEAQSQAMASMRTTLTAASRRVHAAPGAKDIAPAPIQRALDPLRSTP